MQSNTHNRNIMHRNNSDTDAYGDGDIPKVDYEPYQNNHYEPHPQTRGDNRVDQGNKNRYSNKNSMHKSK